MKRSPRKATPLFNAYKADPRNMLCEMTYYLGLEFDVNRDMPIPTGRHVVKKREQTHHIFSPCHMRPDYVSNFCGLSTQAHLWMHAGGGRDCKRRERGTILCLLAKLTKAQETGDSNEFNIDELDLSHGHSVIDWLTLFSYPKSDWMHEYYTRLLTSLSTPEPRA